jgi:hypothetical protein
MTWIVEEMRPDGSWTRCSMGHAWETKDAAYDQCYELTVRYPTRIFAVTEMENIYGAP